MYGILYNFARLFIGLFQTILWKLNGTGRTLAEISRTGKSANKVQLLKVWWRYKFEEIAISKLEDFVTIHDSFVDPRNVYRDDVTLYLVTKTHAVFVRTPSDLNVYSSDVHPFCYQAQFLHATHVVMVPLPVFHRLANEIGDPASNVVIVCTTGRCGSTALSQIFESIEGGLSISEPDALTCVRHHDVRHNVSIEEFKQLTRNIVRMQCKPMKRLPLHICIKTRFTIDICDVISNIMRGNIRQMFMYRNVQSNILSLNRAMAKKPMFKMANLFRTNRVLRSLFPRLGKLFKNALLAHDDHQWIFRDSTIENASLPGIFSLIFGGLSGFYLKHIKNGIDIAGVQYEDILENPRNACRNIFEYCNVPLINLEKALASLERDSQRGSTLSRAAVDSYDPSVLTAKIREEVDGYMTRLELPLLGEGTPLHGTITH